MTGHVTDIVKFMFFNLFQRSSSTISGCCVVVCSFFCCDGIVLFDFDFSSFLKRFFALIVTQSYTANLAASLTKVSIAESFHNLEELSRQSEVRYGLTSKGATEQLFKVPKYFQL